MDKPGMKLNPDLTFDANKQTITIKGELIKLTTKESELFNILAENKNDLTERREALIKVWSEENYFNARSMDVYITKLRKILKPLSSVEIINIHGRGYKLIVDNAYDQAAIPAGSDS